MIQLIQLFEGDEIENEKSFFFDREFFRLDDLNSKYRFMEMNLLQKKKRLKGKLPDIQICLGILDYIFILEKCFEIL